MHIRKLLLVLGAVVALTACGTDRAPATNPPPAAAASTPLAPPVSPGPAYRSAVEEQVAVVLHSTTAQLAAQLKADGRLTLMNLAKPAGIAQDKLAAAIRSALTDATDAATRPGGWTAGQAEQEKRYWTGQSDPDLISEISRWLREN